MRGWSTGPICQLGARASGPDMYGACIREGRVGRMCECALTFSRGAATSFGVWGVPHSRGLSPGMYPRARPCSGVYAPSGLRVTL